MNKLHQTVLMKIAAKEKTPALLGNICMARCLAKTAKAKAINDYTKACILHKRAADLGQTLNDAWNGVQEWWKDDANKAGLATGAAGALGTYGLTGLIPGLKNNTALRLALAGAGGYGAYKGGQWGANRLMENSYSAGASNAQKEYETQLADKDSQIASDRAEYRNALDRERATSANASNELEKQLTTAKSEADALRAELAKAQVEGSPEQVQRLTEAGAKAQAQIAALTQKLDVANKQLSDVAPFTTSAAQEALRLGSDQYYRNAIDKLLAEVNKLKSYGPTKEKELLAKLQEIENIQGLTKSKAVESAFGQAREAINARRNPNLVSADSTEYQELVKQYNDIIKLWNQLESNPAASQAMIQDLDTRATAIQERMSDILEH